MIYITCESCKRDFDSKTAYQLHFSCDLLQGVANGAVVETPEQFRATYPERARCGNDGELKGRGLYMHRGHSVRGSAPTGRTGQHGEPSAMRAARAYRLSLVELLAVSFV